MEYNLHNYTYLPLDTLVLCADGEYGYHVYFKHGYKDLEFSFYTEYEDLSSLVNEILERIKEYEIKN